MPFSLSLPQPATSATDRANRRRERIRFMVSWPNASGPVVSRTTGPDDSRQKRRENRLLAGAARGAATGGRLGRGLVAATRSGGANERDTQDHDNQLLHGQTVLSRMFVQFL